MRGRVDKDLSARLSALRESRGLTHRQVRYLALSRYGRTLADLSRWERGVTKPSYDNLAILGRIYGVPLDRIVDCVGDEELTAECSVDLDGDVEALVRSGIEQYKQGRFVRSMTVFNAVLRSGKRSEAKDGEDEFMAWVSLCRSIALTSMGELGEAEHSLRATLSQRRVSPLMELRVNIQLSHVLAKRGELRIAGNEAEACLRMADALNDDHGKAYSEHNLGFIATQSGDSESAIKHYERARNHYTSVDDTHGALSTRASMGGEYVKTGHVSSAFRILIRALEDAKTEGYDRFQALAACNLAAGHFVERDYGQFEMWARMSDAISGSNGGAFADIQFMNELHRWKASTIRAKPHSARIHLKRLQNLLPRLGGLMFAERKEFVTAILPRSR